MNYVHAPLTSAHAQLISAPHVNGYDPTAEMIKQEQLRGLQIRNNTASAPQQSTPQKALSGGGVGGIGGGVRVVRSGTQSAQDQIADLQLQKMRRDISADQVVESNERFGKHSPDAVWDPTNGGRWVRPYDPGEKEAIALYHKFSVTEPFQISAEGRAEDRAIRESDVKLQNVIGEYIAKKRADVATLPTANQDLQSFRDKLMGKVKITLSNKMKGLPIEDENVDLQDDLKPILKRNDSPSVQTGYSVGTGANGGSIWGGNVVSDGNFGF